MIKIATANIRFDNPADLDHNWGARRGKLSQIINDFSAQVLGTQEGWEYQLKDFESLLSNLSIIDKHRDWIDDRMYPSIYIDTDRVEYLDSGDIWLSETPYIAASKSFDSAFPRLCTWAKLRDKETGISFIFVNAHLDHLQSHTRTSQIGVLIEEISKIKEDYPIILTGDFNESPFEGVRKSINSSELNLTDPWFNLVLDECESHHGFKGKRENGSRIDWILHDKDHFQCSDIYMNKQAIEGIYPSDHFPIFAILSAK